MADVQEITVHANSLDFPVLSQGEGPLAICLHGFPDQARSWTPLMGALAGAGYRAVAPAMRGYWPGGAAPDGCYQAWATGSDALALIEALGEETAVVIGHDWGATAAYAAAAMAPQTVSKLVTMAVPRGPQLAQSFVADGDQQRRSWYMFYFQTPFAPMAVALNDYAFIDRLWAEWSPGYVLPDADRAALKAMFGQPGVVDAALAYYRQIFGLYPTKPEWAEASAKAAGPITMPALYLHGVNDGCIAAGLADGMEASMQGPFRKVVIENAGHFLQLEQPQAVAGEILAFLAS